MMDQLRGYTVNGTPTMLDSPTMLDTPSMTMMTTPDLGASTSSSIHFAPRPSVSSSSSSSRPQPRRDGGGGGNINEEDEASSSMSASSSPTSSRAGFPSRRPSHARQQQRRDGGGSPTITMTSAPIPTSVQNAVSAFSAAGKQRADGRRGGGGGGGGGTGERSGDGQPPPPDSPTTTTTMNTTTTNTNTRKVPNPDEYPDTPAFRQVDQVLRRVQEEWPNLVRGTSLATAAHGGERGQEEEADLAFDPVSLALELLEPDRERSSRAADEVDHHATSRRQNLTSFLRLKAELDSAIKSTLSPRMNPAATLESGAGGVDAYRAYETAITTHNATLSTLTHAQKLVGGMRTGLVTTRERLEGQLGAKEGGLAGMYARLGMLEEMGSLLDEM